MDYKSKKLIQIEREWLGNGENKFEINGVDLSRAIFFFREKHKRFEPIPKGNYRISNENNNTYINIDEAIKSKAYEYQIIYEDRMKSSSYNEEFPELKVLVRKYNELQKDVENIVEEIKTTGIKADTSKMTQILTTLEPNTFWATDKRGEITSMALGDLNSKYEEMLRLLRRDAEMLIEDVKNSSLNTITEETTRKIQELYNSYNDKDDELRTLSNNLKDRINSEIKTEGDSYFIVKTNELETKINEEKQELDNYTNQLKADSRTEINNYINNNMSRIKGERGYGITNIEGNNGSVRISYSDGLNVNVPIPTVPGPRGEKGDKGDIGEKGDKGDGITNISATEDGKLKFVYGNNSQEVITNIVSNNENKLNISDAWKIYTKVIGNKETPIDLNTVTEIGEYVSNSNANKWIHKPDGFNNSFYLKVESIGGSYRLQTMRDYETGKMVYRVNNHWDNFNSWSKWENIAREHKEDIIVESQSSAFANVDPTRPETHVKFKYNINDYDLIVTFNTSSLTRDGKNFTIALADEVTNISTKMLKKLISIQKDRNSEIIGVGMENAYITDEEIVFIGSKFYDSEVEKLFIVMGIKY